MNTPEPIKKLQPVIFLLFALALWCAGCGGGATTATKTQTLVATGYTRESLDVLTRCQRGDTLYGERISDSHWVFSNDAGNTWTDTGSTALTNPKSFQQCQFLHGFKFLATFDGRIFRTTPDDWSRWVEVSVPQRPAQTVNRPDMLVGNDTFLYYGTYFSGVDQNASVYRSADDGATWVTILATSNPDIHGIAIDPHQPSHLFVDVGDKGVPGAGLWFSPSNGDPGTFTHLSSNENGIDMVFHDTDVIMEGDGVTTAQVLIFHHADNPQPATTDILLQGDPNPPDGKGSLQGTGRCIALTKEGNLFFVTKPEGAPDRHRPGIWMAAGPALDQEVLLEEIDFVPLAKTLEVGPYLFVGNSRIRKPALSLQ